MSDLILKVSVFLSKLTSKIAALIVIVISLFLGVLGVKQLVSSVLAIMNSKEVSGSFEYGVVYGGIIAGPILLYVAYRFLRYAFKALKV
ncbi:hypothetical protein [Teredinibacter sp. KSP-S5-2]|uniref:hypothetical protein n=1 Tax=Teredinibacter sp. KSP-S5-2 TaxID=3034506 RepID=UPI00293513B5|nr:hypothetical protein [Teredinibacter sp. KSP-S5-2]WNO07769.1 hypothetical protein P5V12_12290 [Teredinibacter sp. KSP-S5-2]